MSPARKYAEALLVLAVIGGAFGLMGMAMGPINMINTIMNTAYDLLINTVFYLMAITVIVGALSAILIEFGVVRLLEKLLAPLMKPLFGLPGVASLGGVLCFLSDNPAILSLTKDKGFRAYFKNRQLYSLVNFGTAFGMGLIVVTYMIGQGGNDPRGIGFTVEALLGLAGAAIGALASTRLMQLFVGKTPGADDPATALSEREHFDEDRIIAPKNESVFVRFLNAILDGGKAGLAAGLAIIPGVLIISTAVMMLTNGPADGARYAGKAYEGVAVLPWIGTKLKVVFDVLFGFTSPAAVAFPITSLGAVGAALGLVPKLLRDGLIGGNDIAVFTAIGMCWSGYLSTHTAMMDALGRRDLIGRAIGAHTIGGLVAGVSAHYLVVLFKAVGWL